MIIFCKISDVLFLPVVFIVQIPMLKGSHFLVQIHLYRQRVCLITQALNIQTQIMNNKFSLKK